MSSKLLDGVVLSDENIKITKAAMEVKASKLSTVWISTEVLMHATAATAVAVGVYFAQPGLPISLGKGTQTHLLVGALLGMLLVARVVMGYLRVQQAASNVQNFCKSCRSIAVLSTCVCETLTISAAAETEKRAITKFRIELVRLLNLAFSHYLQMLKGMKLAVPPATLLTNENKSESEMLSAVANPTVMVCKALSSQLEVQRQAKRVTSEQTALILRKVTDLVDTYHASLDMQLAPSSVTISAFSYFFTLAWVYLAGAVFVLTSLADSTTLVVTYTLPLALFFLGLYEAGNTVEEPLAYVHELLSTEDLMSTLSDDISSIIVSDGSVAVLLPKAAAVADLEVAQ